MVSGCATVITDNHVASALPSKYELNELPSFRFTSVRKKVLGRVYTDWVMCSKEWDAICGQVTRKTPVTVLASKSGTFALITPEKSQAKVSKTKTPIISVATKPEKEVIQSKVAKPTVMFKKTINFSFDETFVNSDQANFLNSKKPDILAASRVHISGFTDNVGGKKYNDLLAEKRAESIASFVIQMGVNPKNIEMESEGLCCYIASNDTPDGKSKNRRVEIIVYK